MFTKEEIASICYEANRGLQVVLADPAIPVAPPWDLSAEMQESIIDGVQGILDGKTPAESHQNWMDFKLARGWKYGEVKDEEARTHPLLVPFDQLGQTDRVKDELFAAIVKALSA